MEEQQVTWHRIGRGPAHHTWEELSGVWLHWMTQNSNFNTAAGFAKQHFINLAVQVTFPFRGSLKAETKGGI